MPRPRQRGISCPHLLGPNTQNPPPPPARRAQALPPAAAGPYMPRPCSTAPSNSPPLPPEIARRRTFAIISHPDAGKTTLTEKFLLYGGAIQMAGQVRAKGEARRTRSDFMKLEQERGISVSASAMSVPVPRLVVQPRRHARPLGLLRGHLPHADRRRRRGHGHRRRQGRREPDPQALRGLPPARHRRSSPSATRWTARRRDTFEIIDEIQHELQLDVCPATWPIGQGRDFLGCYDMLARPAAS